MIGRSRRVRTLGLALALAAVLAGCSQPSNTPEGYDDTTKSNFLQGCTELAVTGADESTTTSSLGEGLSEEVCTCAYDWIVQNVPFDDFKTLDDQLRDDPQAVPATIVDGLRGACPGWGETTSVGPTTSSTPTTAGAGTSIPG